MADRALLETMDVLAWRHRPHNNKEVDVNEEDGWAHYARLQRKLRDCHNAVQTAGIEAAMDTVLDAIASGRTLTSKQVDDLIANRSYRERKRKAIAVSVLPKANEVDGESAILHSLTLERLRRACAAEEFSLLVRVGKGFTYGELAITYAAPIGTLKARVHRLRERYGALAA